MYGSFDKFDEFQRSILEQGYIAISLRPRIYEIAAPIYKNGEIYAAIAVYMPEFLISDEEKVILIKEICENAESISERI